MTKDLDPTTTAKLFVYVNTTEGSSAGKAFKCNLIDYTNSPSGDITEMMSQTKELAPASSVLLTTIINKPTGVDDIQPAGEKPQEVSVYTVDGRILKRNVKGSQATDGLSKGLYIIDKKVYKK